MPEAAWNFQWMWNYFSVHGEVPYDTVIPVAETDGEVTRQRVAQYNAAVLEYRAQRETEGRRRVEAEAKAEATFLALLSEENRRRYASARHIIIKGSAGGTYQINYGYSANVGRLDRAGRIAKWYCGYPVGMVDHERRPLPWYDAMIAQMLMLVTDEQLFLDTAY